MFCGCDSDGWRLACWCGKQRGGQGPLWFWHWLRFREQRHWCHHGNRHRRPAPGCRVCCCARRGGPQTAQIKAGRGPRGQVAKPQVKQKGRPKKGQPFLPFCASHPLPTPAPLCFCISRSLSLFLPVCVCVCVHVCVCMRRTRVCAVSLDSFVGRVRAYVCGWRQLNPAAWHPCRCHQ